MSAVHLLSKNAPKMGKSRLLEDRQEIRRRLILHETGFPR